MAEPRRVLLAGDTDFDGFRNAARALLQQRVAPDDVRWAVAGDAEPELFGADASALAPRDAAAPLLVPPEVVTLCRDAALHADRTRFALLYRLLWRLQHELALRHDPLDADVIAVRRMAHDVTHEMHKMTAYVRFRPVRPDAADDAGEPTHIAWFEPEHHIVDAVAPFFVRRFAGMRWAILTPRRCIHWDGQRLEHGPGARAQDAPGADAGEALWLTYYRSIFNPARVNVATMQRHMPRRWWPNLPEAALIGELAAGATACSSAMLAREPRPAARRLPAGATMATSRKPLPPVIADDAAAQLQAQREAAAGCRECPLGALATQTVWGEGPLDAPLMLVGEQPGDQEDLQGKPFVGPAGQLLDRALSQLGWDRSLLYVTNAVKHFKYEPRGKRRMHKTPAQKEADACRHWLDSEIALVRPQALVALGATAARQLLGRAVAVTRERGQWLAERADGVPVLVTLHPSALLRADAADREANFAAWLHDLQQAARHVERRKAATA